MPDNNMSSNSMSNNSVNDVNSNIDVNNLDNNVDVDIPHSNVTFISDIHDSIDPVINMNHASSSGGDDVNNNRVSNSSEANSDLLTQQAVMDGSLNINNHNGNDRNGIDIDSALPQSNVSTVNNTSDDMNAVGNELSMLNSVNDNEVSMDISNPLLHQQMVDIQQEQVQQLPQQMQEQQQLHEQPQQVQLQEQAQQQEQLLLQEQTQQAQPQLQLLHEQPQVQIPGIEEQHQLGLAELQLQQQQQQQQLQQQHQLQQQQAQLQAAQQQPVSFSPEVPNINNTVSTNTSTRQHVIRKARKSGASKYLGVCWYGRTQKWTASITVAKKNIHIGYFSTEDDAAR